jgi:hypothetical protein
MPKGPQGQKRKADVIGFGIAARLEQRLWNIRDIVNLIDAYEFAHEMA